MKRTNNIDTEKLIQARGKWEVLRRSKSFQDDFQKRLINDSFQLNEKYKIIFDPSLNLELSFDGLLKEKSDWHLSNNNLSRNKAHEAANRNFIWILIDGYNFLYSERPVCFDRGKNSDIEDTGILQMSINLNYSKNQIENEFSRLLNYAHLMYRRDPIVKEKEKKKHPHRWDLFPKYFMVYDMKNKGIAPSKIAKEIFPGDFDGKIKVDQYYKKAKSLVTNPLQVC